MSTHYADSVIEQVTSSHILLLLVLVGIAAAMAQAATEERLTWRSFLRGVVASLFVIVMSWLGLVAFGFGATNNDQRLWVSGLAAFAAKYLLRGFNTVLERFALNPQIVAMKLASILRRSAAVISPDSNRKEK